MTGGSPLIILRLKTSICMSHTPELSTSEVAGQSQHAPLKASMTGTGLDQLTHIRQVDLGRHAPYP